MDGYAKLLADMNRDLLLVFDFCRTDRQLRAQRRATKAVQELKDSLDETLKLEIKEDG